MQQKYKTDDIATTLGVSIRTAQRYVESLLNKENGKYSFNKDVFNLLLERHSNDNQTTDERQPNDNQNTDGITEFFTTAEYQEFQKRLIEYPLIKSQMDKLEQEIEYHKNQYGKLMEQHAELIKLQQSSIKALEQRNWIEAKEKRLDE